jgi:hypothetical protein
MLTEHVDDQLIACNNRSMLNGCKARPNSKTKCSDGGPVNYFLGFNVFRDRVKRKLYISQEHYMYKQLYDTTELHSATLYLPGELAILEMRRNTERSWERSLMLGLSMIWSYQRVVYLCHCWENMWRALWRGWGSGTGPGR